MTLLLHSLVGGILIGLAAAGLILLNGRVAGVSGVLAGGVSRAAHPWQWAFLAGLLAAGLAARLNGAAFPAAFSGHPLVWQAGAGLLVGLGTRLGGGCTSGHGVCGLGNLSPRSLVATVTFMLVAGVVVFLGRHVEPVRHLLSGWGGL